jgi:hypothetical protein
VFYEKSAQCHSRQFGKIVKSYTAEVALKRTKIKLIVPYRCLTQSSFFSQVSKEAGDTGKRIAFAGPPVPAHAGTAKRSTLLIGFLTKSVISVGDDQSARISDDPHARISDAETDLALSRLSREDREAPLLAVTIN